MEPVVENNRGALIAFIVVGVLLVGLLAGGVWWAKNRSEALANQPVAVEPEAAPAPTEEKPQEVAPTPQPQSQPQPQPQPSSQQQGATDTPAPTPTPAQTPATGPETLPDTGPASDFILTTVFMAIAGYFGIRLAQLRQALRP